MIASVPDLCILFTYKIRRVLKILPFPYTKPALLRQETVHVLYLCFANN